MIGAADPRRKVTGIALALLLVGLQATTIEAVTEPDPQSLWLEARQALQRGDVERARSAVATIRETLRSDADWDPDGSFAERLLPDLDGRIVRMQTAIEELAALPGSVKEVSAATETADDPADPEIDLERARLRSNWLLDELDRIASTMPQGPERGALVQSEHYTRAADLVARDVLPEVADAVRTRFGELERGDERLRAVKARMDSLKREVIDGSVEREGLEEQLAAAREDQDAYRQVLIEFIGDDPEIAKEPASQGLQGIGLALARRIREVWIEVRSLERQTPAGQALLFREVECLRLANVASVADGSRDLGARIDALVVAVEGLPVTEAGGIDPTVGTTGCMAAFRP